MVGKICIGMFTTYIHLLTFKIKNDVDLEFQCIKSHTEEKTSKIILTLHSPFRLVSSKYLN